MGECIVLFFNFQCTYNLMCSNFKWHCGSLLLSIAHSTQCLDHKNEIQIKGLEKCCIANEGCNAPSTNAPINETI